jgi:uncharacterized protein (DUF924 family)
VRLCIHPDSIIHFWFTEVSNAQRFAKDEALDVLLRQRFEATLQAAIAGELFKWRQTVEGRLAEILVLDQFSRNIYRDTPAAFSQDAQALCLAQELVRLGLDQELPPAQLAFAYMPYMHSESLLIHQRALDLFSQPGLEGTLAFEHGHRAILERFGRYPHRNVILGRPSTPEESDFLNQPGSSF